MSQHRTAPGRQEQPETVIPLDITPGAAPPPAGGPTAQLCRAATVLRNQIERVALRPDGLTWNGFTLLQLVVRHPRIQPQRAASALGITNPALTALTHTLIKRDLIRRYLDPEDRRCALLVPTRYGWELAHQLAGKVTAEETRLLVSPPDTPNTAAHILKQAAQINWMHSPAQQPVRRSHSAVSQAAGPGQT